MISNERTKLAVYLFTGLVVLNCLVFSFQVIDPTLVTRFSFLAFFIAGFSIFIAVYFRKELFKIDLISTLFFVSVLYSVASLFWTFNLSLGIIDVSKTILFFLFLILTNVLLDKYESDYISIFIKFITILFFISILPFVYNVIDIPSFSRENMYNVLTISGHKNLYSSLLFLISTFSFLGLFYVSKKWKYVLIFSIIIQLVLVGIIQARAVYLAYVTFLTFVSVLFFLHRIVKSISTKSIVYGIVISLISLNVFFIFLFPAAISAYVSHLSVQIEANSLTELSTLSERVLIWEKTYNVISHNWVVGIGGGNWSVFYPSFSLPDVYKATDLNTIFQRPHNDFLEIYSEYGIIGLNSFYLFIIVTIVFLYKVLITNYHFKYIVLIAGIMGYLTISFFSFPGERIEHNLLFFSLISISIFYIKKHIPYITKREFGLKIPLIWIATIISSVIFFFSILNLKGEYLTKKMQVEKMKKNYIGVIDICTEAESFCYELDPTSMPLSWYKGNAYIKLNQNQNALSSFKVSLSQNPYNQYVLNDLASGYYMVNKFDSAKYYYMESSRINPRFDDPKLNLTAIFINENNYVEAEKWNASILHDSERRDYYTQIINSNKKALKSP